LAIYFLSYLARTVSRAALLHRSNAEKNSPVAIIGLIDLSGTINELECTWVKRVSQPPEGHDSCCESDWYSDIERFHVIIYLLIENDYK
jgi:hypothetical protein